MAIDHEGPMTVAVGDAVSSEQGILTVTASCGQNLGRWMCAGCARGFRNNWDLWSSTCYKRHRIAWLCYEHGPEIP